jgi:Tfp pilus assembly protein FimV
MKRVLISLLMMAAPIAIAQTSAPAPSPQELIENINILKGRVDDLTDTQHALEKEVHDLQSKVDELTTKLAKPPVDYATKEDIKTLTSAIQDVDKKRQSDNDNIVKAMKDLASISHVPAPTPAPAHSAPHADAAPLTDAPPAAGPGFTYQVKPNDTLVKISHNLFADEHVKVSPDKILKANPSLKGDARNLKEGDTIFIPSSKPTDSADNR